MVVNPDREQVHVKLDWRRLSRLCHCTLESKKSWVLDIGMSEVSETQFNATTNLIGGKKKRDKVHPCFICCLVVFLIDSDRLLVSLESLLVYTTSTPLEASCCCLVGHSLKDVEQCLFSWDREVCKVEYDDVKMVEEEVSCNLLSCVIWPSHAC
jgi:hypothetical protein